MSRYRERALASLGAILGMLAILAALVAFAMSGNDAGVRTGSCLLPSPLVRVWQFLLALLFTVPLGAEASRLLLPRGRACSSALLAAGCMLGTALGLIMSTATASLVLPKGGGSTGAAAVVVATCTLVSGWLGGAILFWPLPADPARRRIPRVRVVVSALLLGWFLVPLPGRFPVHGSLEERARWSQAHIVHYGWITSTIAEMPAVVQDAGHVTAMAPTAGDPHVACLDMNSDGINLSLDVVGDKGAGVFKLTCEMDRGRDLLVAWQRASWTFGGTMTPIAAPVPPQGYPHTAPRGTPSAPADAAGGAR